MYFSIIIFNVNTRIVTNTIYEKFYNNLIINLTILLLRLRFKNGRH